MRRTKSIKKRIRLSYVILVCVVIISTYIPIFSTMTGHMQRDAIRNSQLLFENIASNIDVNLEKIDMFALNLTLDSNINEYLDVMLDADNITPEKVDFIYDLQKRLSETMQVNEYIEGIYVYNVNNNVILSAQDGVYRVDDFADSSWTSIINSNEIGDFVLRADGTGKETLSIVHGIPMISMAKHGYVIVNISMDVLNRFSEQEDITVLNAHGDVLKQGPNCNSDILEHIPNAANGQVKFKHSIITWYSLEYAHLKFINIIDNEYITTQLLWVLLKSLALTVIGIIPILLMIMFLSRKTYRPYKRIMDAVGEHERDETEVITERIRKYVSDNKKLENDMRLMKMPYNDNLIKGILNGRYNSASQLDMLFAEMDFDTVGNTYRVVLIEIDDFKHVGTESEQELWEYGIANIAEEIISRRFMCVFCREYEIAGIINSDTDDLKDDTVVHAVLSEVRDAIWENLNISVTCAVSDSMTGVEGIADAYRQAIGLSDYKFIFGGGSILMNNVTKSTDGTSMPLPELNTKKIVNAIKVKDYGGVKSECDDFTNNLIERRIIYKEIVAANVLRSIMQIMRSLELDEEEKSDIYRLISNARTVDELNASLLHIFDNIMQNFPIHEKRGYNYQEQIIKYINDNYKDPNISLTDISDKIGVSVSYVSTIINSAAKTTLTNYVNQRRIEDAKKILIDNPQMSIDKVREMVGYNNVHSFIRQFKNFEGITPGKYREINMRN